MTELKRDKWGYCTRTFSDACIAAINSYSHEVLSYGKNPSVILQATVHDPNCVLANVLTAHFLSPSETCRAASHLHAALSRLDQATPYEKAVFDSVNALLADDRDDDIAVDLHLKLLLEFPRDLLSLKRAQVLCFYMGRPDVSLKLVKQVIAENQQEDFIYGMLAFPLLEVGQMVAAEEAAKKGLEINMEDCWAQHALCHVLQYNCNFKEAVDFMKQCSPAWNCSSFMYTHNWWHVALCYLDGNASTEQVLDIYDNYIWNELEKCNVHCGDVYLNAAGLLLRIYARGETWIIGNRLKALSQCLLNEAMWFLEWQLDLFTLWALAYCGESMKADTLFNGLKSRVSRMNIKKQKLMQKAIVLAQALLEYGKGNRNGALELLGPNFNSREYKMIGASEEQLDVFDEVWYSMLLDAGEFAKVAEAVEKWVSNRGALPPFMSHILNKCYSGMGKNRDSMFADENARDLEKASFSSWST